VARVQGREIINGLFESHRNRAPVVLIASQLTSEERDFDFPQEVDFESIYRSCSVFCSEIRSPAQARRKTAMAAQAALSRRGVAVLILPVDISKAAAPDEPTFTVHRTTPILRPSDTELDRVADLINAGRKVVIYGGSGCQGAHDEIVALADRLKAPIAHTSRAKDFLEYDNPFDVGMTGMLGTAGGYYTVKSCDTLLLLGCDFAWRQFYPDKAHIIQVDSDPTHLGRRHPVELGVVGDIKETAAALLSRLAARTDRQFLDDCLARHRKAAEALDQRAMPTHGGKIRPQYLASLIDQHADADAIFTADGGSPLVWLLRHITANGKRRTLTSLTHGTMANAMPQALGAKRAFPRRQVISLSGDGGLAMLMGDLLTAVQEKIPIKIAVFDNSALGFVELEMKIEGLLDAYTKLENPDFARVAKAIGFHARRVERAEALEGAVRDWLAEPGPALLDVVTSRLELVRPPTVQAAHIFGTGLYSAKAVLGGRAGDVWDLVTENL
jgi:pyruvate dehydrogenase (quinone)